MPTSYTSLLGLALPVTGELQGTWGTTVNDSITELVEDAIAATATASVTSGNWTLSTTGSGAANEARCAILIPTGTPGVSRNIIAPSQSKAYIVINQSNAAVVLKGAATTGVTIATGTEAVCAWNGSDFVVVATADIGNLSGTLPVANGGTGQTSLTLNNVILGNGTSAVQFVAPGSNGNVLTSNGTTWTSAAVPPGGLTYIVKTANYTAQDKEGVLANTTSGAFTVTLPATPATGAQVVVADAGGVWGTNNLTVGRNGSTISNVAQDLVCDISGVSVQLVYDGTTWEVYAQVGGNGGIAAVTNASNIFTAAQTFRAANAIRSEAASTQDAIVVAGRAGGTSSYAVTLTPATLSASRTFTLPDPGENVTVGYLNIPQNSESVNYTLVATDSGKHIFHPSADTTARTFTIPANSSVPFEIGTAITFINQNGAGVVTIAITSDTMRLAGAGTTGSRTLAANGIATAIKVTSTEWIISGTGLT